MFFLFNSMRGAFRNKHLPGRFSKTPLGLAAPRKIQPYSIKGMLRGQKIEVSEKRINLDFI
jgi:hypothetical protein